MLDEPTLKRLIQEKLEKGLYRLTTHAIEQQKKGELTYQI